MHVVHYPWGISTKIKSKIMSLPTDIWTQHIVQF
jgi:hypothetical protein